LILLSVSLYLKFLRMLSARHQGISLLMLVNRG
jgi:hypothetical protein